MARPISAPPTFYAAIEPFLDFAAVADPARYRAAPDDWIVVLADIRGSTEAAKAGRYKDVNLIGAACITAILNVTKGLDLPYVFGGDGATVLIPPDVQGVVADALRRTRRLAASGFGLELRVGMVPVEELKRRGRRVLVARYQLSPGNHLAMFAGGGIALADQLIKDGAGFGLEDDGDPAPPDLAGLSCRWQPYQSLHGHMLSLLVRTLDADDLALQRQIVARLGEILGAGADAAGPVQPANMRFVWPPQGLAAEALLTQGRRPRWLRRSYLMLESLLQLIAERFDLRLGAYDAPAYREELRRNSDHRKLADSLHLVLDCTEAEVAAIEAYLAGLHAAGKVVYGTHRAAGALMTCLVFSLEQSRHVHFIDGADGGYALAALQLKAQLQAPV
ncbi:MAG: hypothetical protein K0S35_798, partial [Geminicoccaceae bacterium]|nr:hypothetical protein [Geminicoccaceae bacterium]